MRMRRIFALLALLLFAAGLSACGGQLVIVVTATPTAVISTVAPTATATIEVTAVPSETPQPPTPTREVLNPHQSCAMLNAPADCIVNRDAGLETAPVTEVIAGRTVQRPTAWQYQGEPALQSVHPEVYQRGDGYQFDVSWKDGTFGYQSPVTVYANQRYLLRIVYSVDVPQAPFTQGSLNVVARLYLTSGQRVDFTPQPVPASEGYFEGLWVFEMGRADEPVIYGAVNVPYAIFGDGSTMTIYAIELMAVSDTFGGADVQRVQ